MRPKISIIIPTYKPSELFFECLSSISRQSYDNFELIIVLNGCNEPYYSKISVWISELNMVQKAIIVQTDKGGVSNARNIGLDLARGNYIAFIDDDDLITKRYIEELDSGIGDNTTLVVSNVELYPPSNGTQINYPPAKQYEIVKERGFKTLYSSRRLLNAPWMKLFPKSMIGSTRFDTHISLGEDALFCFTISKNVKHIYATSSSAKYLYRLRNGGNSWVNKSQAYLLFHMIYLIYRYTTIYLSSPLKYSFKLFINRIMATIKSFSTNILKKAL
ncbi:MAG: glycosyltransferase family 2 protein [Bacteroides sp.]|nr:glycosyltransferase family 2 protein [Bacteroides sp.]